MTDGAEIRVPVPAEFVTEREREGGGVPQLGGAYPLTIGGVALGNWALTRVEYEWSTAEAQPILWATFWRAV